MRKNKRYVRFRRFLKLVKEVLKGRVNPSERLDSSTPKILREIIRADF